MKQTNRRYPLREYEKQLISGLSETDKEKLIGRIDAINKKTGLKQFGR